MEHPLTPSMLEDNPSLLTRTLAASGDLSFTGRLLRPQDGEALGRYFDGLTEAITGVYGPHPLNSEHAVKLCADIDYARSLRFVVEMGAEIQGYFIVDMGVREKDVARYAEHGYPLDGKECCTFAPSVADAYLAHGIGSALMPLILEAVERLGRRRIVLMGGVRADNPRAQHFYRKFGFELVGTFHSGGVDNLDMVLSLDTG